MTEPWILYGVVFVLVGVAALLAQRGIGGLARDRRDKRKRYASLAAGPVAETEALRRQASRFGNSALVARVGRLVVQSGTQLSGATLAGICVAIALLVWLLVPVDGWLRLPVAIGTALAGVGLWLRTKRARRIARFGEQLPEVIDIIVRSLRAGHPLAVSLNLVAREVPEPAGAEFALLVDEVNYGRSLGEALESLSQRVGYPELRFFVASTSIAHQTGGNLGEILSRLSRMLRERFRLARRVRALSAEGRFSGFALSVLPLAMFGIINLVSSSYYTEFWASAAAVPVLSVSLALLLVGNLIIYRLVNFKV